MSISTVERSCTERAIEHCEDISNSLFDHSPAMMARIEISEGLYRLAQVNDRLLESTGYKRDEMLGHDPVAFVSEHTKVRTISARRNTQHLRDAKSVGAKLLKKDGSPFDVLVDINYVPISGQNPVGFAAAYAPDDLTQWQQASTTLRALIELNYTQRKLEVIATGEDLDAPQPDYPPVPRSGLLVQVGAAEKSLGALAKACDAIALNLRHMAALQEGRIDSLGEQGQDLMSVVNTMGNSLEGLGNTIEQMTDPSISELLQTISNIGNGELSLNPTITRRLVQQLSQQSQLSPSVDPITEREAEVLKLVARGFSNKEIAQKLLVTGRTVDKHVSSILGKLDVANRTQAALCALRTGLATLDPE